MQRKPRPERSGGGKTETTGYRPFSTISELSKAKWIKTCLCYCSIQGPKLTCLAPFVPSLSGAEYFPGTKFLGMYPFALIFPWKAFVYAVRNCHFLGVRWNELTDPARSKSSFAVWQQPPFPLCLGLHQHRVMESFWAPINLSADAKI